MTTVHDDIETPTAAPATRRARFGKYYRSRPFIGGLLTVIAGAEIFLSGQLDLTVGKFHVALGIEGLQATIIPLVLVVLGVLAVVQPVHRVFYGVISLALSVYSLVGVNLGGFFLGMIIGIVGGILIVSWLPHDKKAEKKAGRESVDVVASLEEPAAEPRPFVQRRSLPAMNVAATRMRALLPQAAGASGHGRPQR